MIVGRAHLNQRHVQVQDLTSEQQRDLAEEDGSEISTAFVDWAADIGTNEQWVGPKYTYSNTYTASKIHTQYHKYVYSTTNTPTIPQTAKIIRTHKSIL